MRKDIAIHINTGDISLDSSLNGTEYPFAWVSGVQGDNYLYGEVTVPLIMSEATIFRDGIFCSIPFVGKAVGLKVRICRKYSDDFVEYISNAGSEWFDVMVPTWNGNLKKAVVSELALISRRGFHLVIKDGICIIYSASSTDFKIIDANRQNANLMLACSPANYYRYPVTGVGLIRWKESNMFNSGLSEVLEREFRLDGTPVVSASYDFETYELNLQLDTNNV